MDKNRPENYLITLKLRFRAEKNTMPTLSRVQDCLPEGWRLNFYRRAVRRIKTDVQLIISFKVEERIYQDPLLEAKVNNATSYIEDHVVQKLWMHVSRFNVSRIQTPEEREVVRAENEARRMLQEEAERERERETPVQVPQIDPALVFSL